MYWIPFQRLLALFFVNFVHCNRFIVLWISWIIVLIILKEAKGGKVTITPFFQQLAQSTNDVSREGEREITQVQIQAREFVWIWNWQRGGGHRSHIHGWCHVWMAPEIISHGLARLWTSWISAPRGKFKSSSGEWTIKFLASVASRSFARFAVNELSSDKIIFRG